MNFEDTSTLDAKLVKLEPEVAFLTVLLGEGKGQRQIAFREDELLIQLKGQDCWLRLRDGELSFSGMGQNRRLILNQQYCFSETPLRVIDLRTLPPFWLVGLSAPYSDQRWGLRPGEKSVGRPGKRANEISLAHPSISRTHATLCLNDGELFLSSESAALTAVEGERLKVGEKRSLRLGALLQLGELHFTIEEEPLYQTAQPKRVTLQGLGESRVWVDSREICWQNKNAKNLLFWLATTRTHSLPIARVMEEYWPGKMELRQRKNLSHVVTTLNSELGLKETPAVERGAESIKLVREFIESCDFWSLREAIARGSHARVARLLRGALLPASTRVWVRAARRELLVSSFVVLMREHPETEEKTRVLQGVGSILRENEMEELVYLKACELAEKWECFEQSQVWREQWKETTEHQA